MTPVNRNRTEDEGWEITETAKRREKTKFERGRTLIVRSAYAK